MSQCLGPSFTSLHLITQVFYHPYHHRKDEYSIIYFERERHRPHSHDFYYIKVSIGICGGMVPGHLTHCRYQNLPMLKFFYKMMQYLHIAYVSPPLYFISSLGYLKWKLACKLLLYKVSKKIITRKKFFQFNTDTIFFSDSWLVESTDFEALNKGG